MSAGTPMDGLVMVQMRVDNMKHTIMSALNVHVDNIRASIERAVEQAVLAFDFEKAVRAEADRVLAEQVKRSIDLSLREVFRDSDVQKRVLERTAATLKELYS
ncbi:MAG: hypothetical protein KGL39_47100 [Patescibacteria group bacterium]|nr:hypothetical protein [Patescibacteria group bacterium]